MYLKRFYDDRLAHASYLVGCQATGEAIVIDPAREVEQYIEDASEHGLTIKAVAETHIHADFLSGSRQMSHQTEATMYLSKEGGPDWQYEFASRKDVMVSDGDLIEIGNLTLRVLHTPGHTPEHISFLLTDHPASDKPIGVFTGDFVVVGDVGRPDLLEKAAGLKDTMKQGALELYASIQKFKQLPDHLQIWPAHGAGSACGKALGAVPSSVLGYEKLYNWALVCPGEEQFVAAILDGQPEPPKYFAQMKRWNKVGPAILEDKTTIPKLDSSEMAEVQKHGTLLDLRGTNDFVAGHPKNAIFLPPGNSFVTWAGWLLNYDEDFHVLVREESQLREIVAGLRSIGLDKLQGYFLSSDINSKIEIQPSKRIEAKELDILSENIVDVRSLKEWNDGHLPSARHIHLGYLLERMADVPQSPVLHCGSGKRSLIASSLLQRAGKDPIDVVGGYTALKERKELIET